MSARHSITIDDDGWPVIRVDGATKHTFAALVCLPNDMDHNDFVAALRAALGDPTAPSPDHALDVGDLVEFDDDRYGVKRARVGTTPGVHVVLLSNGYGHTVPITSVRLVAPFDEVCPHVDEEGHPQEGTIITRSDGSQVCWSCGFIPYDPPAAPSGVSEVGAKAGEEDR